MKKIENAVVRVYIADGFWETGVLKLYFEDPWPDARGPMFFRSNNCDYDVDCRCYVFRLPELGVSPTATREVFIPEKYIVGIAVKYTVESVQAWKMGRVGFPVDDSETRA